VTLSRAPSFLSHVCRPPPFLVSHDLCMAGRRYSMAGPQSLGLFGCLLPSLPSPSTSVCARLLCGPPISLSGLACLVFLPALGF
jgi:hypothetical protein